MVKYNRVSLARKKELEQPDEFIVFSKRMLVLGAKYKTRLLAGVGGVFALAVTILAVQYFLNLSENKAFTQLHEAMEKYDITQTADNSESLNEEAVAGLKDVIDKYPGTVAANLSRVHLADMYYASGKYDDAINLYKDSMSYYKKSPSLYNLVLSGLGYCYEAKADDESAVKYFKMITEAKSDVLKDEAFFSLGRIYGRLGQSEKQAEMLQKIVTDYKDSIYFDMAKEGAVKGNS